MRTALLITIDVESDDLWARKAEITLENIRAMPRLQEFFERHGVRPTYLLTHPVASSALGREVFRPWARAGAAEIGSHMHVWTTPPIEPLTAADHEYCPLATEISYESLRRKLENVTTAVTDLAGQAPVSHRAGRYGLDGQGVRVLEELGYCADTSVTPLLEWSEPGRNGARRGPDFRDAPLDPYYLSRSDVSRPGESPVLEVPVSFFLTRPLPGDWGRRLARLPRNHNLVRALRWTGVVRHAWLRPGREVNGPTLVGVARALMAAGVPVLNVMFHSSEMAVGTSPHTPRQSDVDDSYAQLDALFTFLRSLPDVQPMTLGEYAAAFGAERKATTGAATVIRDAKAGGVKPPLQPVGG